MVYSSMSSFPDFDMRHQELGDLPEVTQLMSQVCENTTKYVHHANKHWWLLVAESGLEPRFPD